MNDQHNPGRRKGPLAQQQLAPMSKRETEYASAVMLASADKVRAQEELGNTMSVLLAGLECIRRKQLPCRDLSVEERVAPRRSENSCAARLMDDLTDLILVRARSLHLQPVPTLVEDLIDEALDNVRAEADEKEVQFIVLASRRRAVIQCDEARVVRALTNLMANAVAFTPVRGEVLVRSWCSLKEVGVEVRDSGPAMRDANRPSAFTPFGPDDQDERTHLIIGLRLAHAMAVAHRGRLSLNSARDEGVSLTFTLPRGLMH